MDPVADYQALLSILNTSEEGHAFREGEVYQELINTEKRALKNASRISTQKFQQENLSELFNNIKLGQLISQFTQTWNMLYISFMNKDLTWQSFLVEDRKIYVGITIIFISVFLTIFHL
jgi:hypothetical protein